MGNNFFHASMNLEDSDWTYAYYQKQGILSFHTLPLKSESDTQNNTNFGYDRQEDTSCHHQSFCWHFFDLTGDCATSDVFFLLDDMMDLYMSSHGSLVPQGPCGVFYATRHQFIEA